MTKPGARRSPWRTLMKWCLLLILTSYVAFMAAWATQASQGRKCKGLRIEVQNVDPALEQVICRGVADNVFRISPVKGEPISSIDIRALEKKINAITNIDFAECGIDAQGYLVVRVGALKPEMRVFTPDGRSYYVNKAGKRMDATPEFFTPVPIVTGSFTKDFPETALMPVIELLRTDSLMHNLVTMIEVRSPEDIILVPRFTGHVINLGNTANLPRKVRYLEAFYRKVMPYKGWHTYDTISVKFAGRVVATRAVKPVIVPVDTLSYKYAEEEEAANRTASEVQAQEMSAPIEKRTTNPNHISR